MTDRKVMSRPLARGASPRACSLGLGGLAAALTGAFWSQPALAQVAGIGVPGESDAAFYGPELVRTGLFDRTQNISVTDRPRPELSVVPIQVGVFDVVPALRVEGVYSSNVLATPQASSDGGVHLVPSVAAQGYWGQNAASLFARVDHWNWANHSSEDFTGFALGAKDRLELGADTGLSAGAEYQSLFEPRTDLASPQGAARPDHYTLASAFVGGAHRFNRVRLVAHVDVKDFTYADNYDTQGALIYQRDRDYLQVSYEGRAEYALNADASVYVQMGGNQRHYRNRLPTEPTRNSSGYDVAFGADFNLTHLVRGDIQVGHLRQTFDSPAFETISGVALRGSLAYFLNPLTTITFSSTQQVGDAGVVGAAGYLQTVHRLDIDHELTRSLIVNLHGGNEEDRITGASRRDQRPFAGASARYLVDRAFGVALDYRYLGNRSSGALRGPDYDEHRVIVSLIVQL
jgi:hypothetical protein